MVDTGKQEAYKVYMNIKLVGSINILVSSSWFWR